MDYDIRLPSLIIIIVIMGYICVWDQLQVDAGLRVNQSAPLALFDGSVLLVATVILHWQLIIF